MIPRPHDEEEKYLDPTSVALVAHADGKLELFVPHESGLLSRAQVFLSAVAFRASDREWVGEQIEFIEEVRRHLDALGNDDSPDRKH